jgi:hypothetical protein
MDTQLIKKKFQQIGSDVEFSDVGAFRGNIPIEVNVKTNKGKEIFDIATNSDDMDVSVLDIDQKDRHLLMLIKRPVVNRIGKTMFWDKFKILCGHDERHYFSAGIPESSGVSTIMQAKEALLPEKFLEIHKQKGKRKNRLKRKNEVAHRQGEWIFIKSTFEPSEDERIRMKEPISRGGGSKPHICEEVCNIGGITVWVNNRFAPNGVSAKQMEMLMKKHGLNSHDFNQRTTEGTVYARGYVRHSDHKTINLPGWHEVLMNRENESAASRISVFLD